jgi:hypothetical protein
MKVHPCCQHDDNLSWSLKLANVALAVDVGIPEVGDVGYDCRQLEEELVAWQAPDSDVIH